MFYPIFLLSVALLQCSKTVLSRMFSHLSVVLRNTVTFNIRAFLMQEMMKVTLSGPQQHVF